MHSHNFSISSSSSSARANRLITEDHKENPDLNANSGAIQDCFNRMFHGHDTLFAAIISQYEPRLAGIEFFRNARRNIAPTNLWNSISLSNRPLISEFIATFKLRDTTPDVAFEKLFEALRGYAGEVPLNLRNRQYDTLTLEEIISFAEFAQNQQDAALQTTWPSIRRSLNMAPMLPSETADVGAVRTWLANPAHEGSVNAVRDLDLRNLALSAVPKEIRLFSGLTELNLSNNQIKNLPIDIFQELGNLRRLYLGQNQIAHLPPGIFQGLGRLYSLYLEQNQIAHLPPGIFQGLGELSFLDLQQNQIVHLPPDVFQGLRKLWCLDLQQNQIVHLPPNIFQGLGRLYSLYLEQNQIAHLPPDTFQGLRNLKLLNLQQNQIAHLPPDVFQGLRKLWIIDLRQNQIVHLPPNIFQEFLEERKLIGLAGNPLAITVEPATYKAIWNRVQKDVLKPMRQDIAKSILKKG